ncbi:MAG TPA: hypothetical protein PKY31_08180 [Spirochaetota bacterium]|nr:hypothetical protein [Spirochaetota bacterium]
MVIDTTVYMRNDIAEWISDMAERAGISRNAMISALLHGFAEKRPAGAKAWSRVRYQDRAPDGQWTRVHVRLKGDEYEYFIDLRKVFKLSVSYVIAIAVKEYGRSVHVMNVDNYRYHNYAMIHFQEGYVHCWLFCWGIPPKLPENLI